MAKVIEDKFIVIKIEDVDRYLTEEDSWILVRLQQAILAGREKENKKLNDYWVCNRDEPYADKIIQTILEGEANKEIENNG